MDSHHKERRRGHRKGKIAGQLRQIETQNRVAEVVVLPPEDLQLKAEGDHGVQHRVEERHQRHHKDDAHVLLGVLLLPGGLLEDLIQAELPQEVLGGRAGGHRADYIGKH